MRTLRLLLLAMALTACVRRVPIIVQTPSCAPELPMPSCTSPVTIKEGSTYAELLADYQTDRQSLQACASQQDYLREVLATCNRLIAEHNQKANSHLEGERP
jgi:sulfur carrier protein ThiS